MQETAWRVLAACRDEPTELFVPDVPHGPKGTSRARFEHQLTTAFSICARCPVKDECLAYGVEGGHAGVWGGKYLGNRARDGLAAFDEILAHLSVYRREHPPRSAVDSVQRVRDRTTLPDEGEHQFPRERSDMTTTRKAKDNGAEGTTQEQPKRTTTKASDHFEPVSNVLKEAGPEGLTLAQLSDLTGIRSRVLHNVVWHLEKAEKIHRVGEGRPIHYASTEVKAPRKRTPRKSTTKKATTKAA